MGEFSHIPFTVPFTSPPTVLPLKLPSLVNMPLVAMQTLKIDVKTKSQRTKLNHFTGSSKTFPYDVLLVLLLPFVVLGEKIQSVALIG